MRHKTKSNVPSHLPKSESSGHEGRESYLRWRAHTCITASVHSLSLQRCRFWTWSKACGETSVCTRLCKGSLLLRRPCLCHLSFLHWAELYMPYMPSRTWFSDRIVVLHRGTSIASEPHDPYLKRIKLVGCKEGPGQAYFYNWFALLCPFRGMPSRIHHTPKTRMGVGATYYFTRETLFFALAPQ